MASRVAESRGKIDDASHPSRASVPSPFPQVESLGRRIRPLPHVVFIKRLPPTSTAPPAFSNHLVGAPLSHMLILCVAALVRFSITPCRRTVSPYVVPTAALLYVYHLLRFPQLHQDKRCAALTIGYV